MNRKSILKATALVVGLTLVSKALGFLKSIIQASYFGATIYTDAYNIANGFVSNILFMLKAKLNVTLIGSPSGTATTIRVTAIIKVFRK